MENEDGTRTKVEGVSVEREESPHVFQAGSIEEFLQRSPRNLMDQEAGEGSVSLEQWEAQWQEFLSTVENPHFGCGIPQLPEKPSPWEDAKAFLASFEQVAEACWWPRDDWVIRLLPALSGEAAKAFNNLSANDKEDYGKVKAAILQGDALRQEKQRQQFRHFCYLEAEGPRKAYSQLWEMCHGWLRVDNHSKEQILEILILEQLLSILPPEMQSWVRENSPESCSQAVALAEEFLLRQEKQAAARCVSEPGQPLSESSRGHPLMDFKEEEGGEVILMVGDEETAGEFQGFSLKKAKNEKPEGNLGDGYGPQKQTRSHVKKLRDRPIPCQGGGFCSVSLKEERPSEERSTKDLCINQRIHSWEKENSNVAIGRTFVESTNIISQEQIHSREKSHNCLECGKSFSRKVALTSHRKIHTGNDQQNEDEEMHGLTLEKTKREEVKGNFQNQGEPKWKEDSHAVEKMNGSISFQGEDFHEVIHMSEETYKCLECEIQLSNQTEYNFHLRTHKEKKTHHCSECGKSFLRQKELVIHYRIHTGEKPYNCCGKGFSRKANFIRHRRRHPEEKPYECSECGKKYRQSLYLQQHQRIHTGEKVFECSECGKRFLQKLHFLYHQKSHADEKLFKCSQREKKFSQSHDLQQHQRTHTGIYECSEYGQKSSQNGHLQQNLRINPGEKPFECLEHGKKFRNRGNLQMHLKIHTGEKPFECSMCGRKFSRKYHLQRHLKIHLKTNLSAEFKAESLW
ncbi:zinc finger protein 397-like [Sphaerodactylus townsendi]|uniref:zinc finger protein 397-like n=1 Tax=Sphaerodactylus townsendi TaxID=933632 RepID=UPI0020264A31|nr:zinc finger protein 397-like [Sphaerodactylus townsendi]XP_048345000.1 zinc finger protein 397-like [Sphaerodactylus townsendi]